PLSWDEVMQCDPADFTVFTVPARFQKVGDPHAAMDQHAGALDALLEMSARDDANGIGDAPWPPHFKKQWNEGKRVQPSKAKKSEGKDVHPAATQPKATGRRKSTMPLLVIAQSPDKAAALAGLERWKQNYPEAAKYLAPDDILTDRMRGSAYVWFRLRVNLRNVPEELRPKQETPNPDEDPTREWREAKNVDA
ncbi:MAG: DNA primase, partial [Terriglobus sp.]